MPSGKVFFPFFCWSSGKMFNCLTSNEGLANVLVLFQIFRFAYVVLMNFLEISSIISVQINVLDWPRRHSILVTKLVKKCVCSIFMILFTLRNLLHGCFRTYLVLALFNYHSFQNYNCIADRSYP